MSDVLHWLIDAVSQHGYIIVFLVIAAESAGAPLPGETVLLTAAFLARQGHLNIGLVIAVAAAAAIIGDNAGYWIGRKGGRPLANRFGRFIFLTPKRLDRCEDFFHKHGGKAVFLARWTSGLRVAGAWVAGMSHMPWPRFLLWNALGGVAWALAVGIAGYVLGASYERAAHVFSGIGIVLGALFVLWVLWMLLRHFEIGPKILRDPRGSKNSDES